MDSLSTRSTLEHDDQCGASTWLNRHARGVHAATVISGTVALSLALFIGALVLRSELTAATIRTVKTEAIIRANDVAEMMTDGEHRHNLDIGGLRGWVWVLDDKGTVIDTTHNLEPFRNSFVPAAQFVRRPLQTGPIVKILSGLVVNNGDPVIVACVSGIAPNGPFTVQAALPLTYADSVLGGLDGSLLKVFPALVAIMGLLAWWLVRRALRPVEAIRIQVAAISASDLHQRVPLPPGQDSINRLAVTMNAMLGRLEQSNGELRQFCADASHELRSPLATMRTNLEASTLEHSEPAWKTMVDELLIDQNRLETLVSDLFLLTRLDGRQPMEQDPIDLGALVQHELSLRPTPVGQQRVVVAPSSIVLGNERSIVRVLRNLVDNAERYASNTVYVSLQPSDSTVDLVVDNDGPPIPPDKSLDVFKRFTRLDGADQSGKPGNGLGLAIVAEIMRSHQGTVRFEPSPAGAQFVATFPTLGAKSGVSIDHLPSQLPAS
jgi:signal transduction histidine kinase